MDNHDIDEGQLHLVALVCILLAAKMEERPNAPLISELNAHVGNQYSVQQFKSMEVMIMEFFKWNLMIPTAVDFAEHFTNFDISTFDVLTVPLELNRHPELHNAVYSYTQCFLDLSLLEVCLLDVKPSLVAAACIAAARQAVRLSSRWPTALENATTYQYEDLEPFVMLLMRRANIKVARGNKRKSTESSDDGYESDDSFTNNLEDSNGQRSSKRSRTCSSSNAVFLHS
ncbi:cyclin-J-like [Periplaneta americana]|uniref:cyclin-J-like n=1 Tax=Periplaneta americana TaxID=6978 RepID=UPI0037E84E3E